MKSIAEFTNAFESMESAGAEQARRADYNHEWALRAERERDAERALADRLAEALEGIWPFIEEDIPHGCNSTAYMNAIELCRANITAWNEARSE